MDRNDVELEKEVPLHDGFFRMVRLHLRHRLFAGGWSPTMTREVVRHGTVAAIIPYDPVRDTVILIEQFRAAIFAAGDPQPWSISIAAGMIEPGESAEEMARRETLEETGCTVGRLEKASEFYSSPGGSSQHVTLFCGEISTEGAGGLYGVADESEDIKAFVKTADEAIAMADSGAIDNAVSILGLQWLARNRDSLRARWT
ncbi:MAG: NUDIX domain-containing protein [Alphaproteobacteria bacterium]|nr:NUDIX domain-containing protein [Alphaproteobacteria bacterium]